ncbi:uncharacterized protein LOC117166141 [Bombus vancouverensis nearcticus]|uniref:uncharacterized protein LOC117166141 n=1 Tax=Bombus vancouverensis nearcticus TaxID=2705178 RepID=UPI00402BC1EA
MESEPNERQEAEETKEADEVAEEVEEDIEEKTTKAGTSDETAEGKPLKQDESVQSSIDEECPSQGWDEHAKERFDTAVFTLGTCAAVFAVYIYIVYSLSSPPTVLHRV